MVLYFDNKTFTRTVMKFNMIQSTHKKGELNRSMNTKCSVMSKKLTSPSRQPS